MRKFLTRSGGYSTSFEQDDGTLDAASLDIAFDSDNKYSRGDIVEREGAFYKANSDISVVTEFVIGEADGEWSKISGSENTLSTQMFQEGVLEDTTGTVKWFAAYASEFTEAKVFLSNPPIGGSITVKIKKNNIVADTIVIPSGSTAVTKALTFEAAEGNYLTVDVDVGSAAYPGKDLSLILKYKNK